MRVQALAGFHFATDRLFWPELFAGPKQAREKLRRHFATRPPIRPYVRGILASREKRIFRRYALIHIHSGSMSDPSAGPGEGGAEEKWRVGCGGVRSLDLNDQIHRRSFG